jgi:alpha-1,3-glucan synthase
LEQHEKVQLICIGPVIDLYGKFAALKLGKMMEKYPGRVYSKPEFTALPPYIFSGAEFALIPSRDEPFGLVAVEFGRKGALGVGARVGGLGKLDTQSREGDPLLICSRSNAGMVVHG